MPGGEQDQRNQRADDQPKRLHGEHESDQSASVLAVGVLAHQDGRHRIVASDAQPQHEPGDHQEQEPGCKAEANAPTIMMTATRV